VVAESQTLATITQSSIIGPRILGSHPGVLAKTASESNNNSNSWHMRRLSRRAHRLVFWSATCTEEAQLETPAIGSGVPDVV